MKQIATNTHYDSIVLRETGRPSPECQTRVIDSNYLCSPTSNNPVPGIYRRILSCGLTNISIGQEVLITTSSARRSANCLASKVYTTIIIQYISCRGFCTLVLFIYTCRYTFIMRSKPFSLCACVMHFHFCSDNSLKSNSVVWHKL